MKLLFDENLSARLADDLEDLFPDSAGVRSLGLTSASDTTVWDFARRMDFILVTKDDDFRELAVLKGSPPKVVFLAVGNCPTKVIEGVLRKSYSIISTFSADDLSIVLELS